MGSADGAISLALAGVVSAPTGGRTNRFGGVQRSRMLVQRRLEAGDPAQMSGCQSLVDKAAVQPPQEPIVSAVWTPGRLMRNTYGPPRASSRKVVLCS